MRKVFKSIYKNRVLALSLVFLLIFSGALQVFATPTGGYAPGAILDPDCAPGSSSNCIVKGGWLLSGNANTIDGTDFIGTTDNVPLNFRVNNQKAGRIDPTLQNVFFGYQAGNANTTGYANTIIGTYAFRSNITGFYNTASGINALWGNTTGNSNTANGMNALSTNTIGSGNTANGSSAIRFNTEGNNNTGNGFAALYSNITGSKNTALGSNADVTIDGLTKATAIGYNAKVGASNSMVLGGTGADAVNVGIGLTIPTARLHLPTSDGSAGTAPLKFTSGTNLGTEEVGAVEWNGTNLFLTSSVLARNILAQISGGTPFTSGSIPFATTNGYLAEDNTNFNWNNTTKTLSLGTINSPADINLYGSITWSGGNGDINGDSFVDSGDEYLIYWYLIAGSSLTSVQRGRADMNGDGRVDWSDKDLITQANLFGTYYPDSPFPDSTKDSMKAVIDTAYGVTDLSAGLGNATFYVNGKIGVGVTSATSKLHLASTGSFGAAGVSGINSAAHTVTLTGANPTTYATFRANSLGAMTLVGTNTNQTVTTASTLYVDSPVASTNVTIGTIKPIDTQTGAFLSSSGVWTDNSSEVIKENYEDIDSTDLLQKIDSLNIQKWNYISDGSSIKHIGPFAEDFYNIFGVGNDNKHIAAIDTAGIALSGIKALDLKIKDINNFEKENNWRDSLVAWFKNTGNGITEFVSGILRAKDKLCIGEGNEEVCITKEELLQMKNNTKLSPVSNNSNSGSTSPETQTDICPNVTGIQTEGTCVDSLCLAPDIWNIETQTCDILVQTCSDEIQNQDETDIDAGGVCTSAPLVCDAPKVLNFTGDACVNPEADLLLDNSNPGPVI